MDEKKKFMKQKHEDARSTEDSEFTKRLGFHVDLRIAKALRAFEDALIERGQIPPRSSKHTDAELGGLIRDYESSDHRSG